ncbi:MAG: DUF6318 family protein [Jatrophihabitans sp.]
MRPGERPPVLSDVGRLNLPVGQITFAQFWFQALDWGYATTDSTLARELFAKACEQCERLSAIFDSAKREGSHFDGGRLHVTDTIVTQDHSHAASVAVDVSFSQDALKKIGRSGAVQIAEPRQAKTEYRVWLSRKSDSWTVVDLKEVLQR